MKSWKRWVIGIVILLVIGTGAFLVWAYTPLGPMPEAIPSLQDDQRITVTTDKWLAFKPLGVDPQTGFIFYPGGRVDATSYAPAARQIASNGYLVVIVRMPLSLAVLGADRAAEVIAAYPEVKHWVIGGHSLGGSMAARYAFNHPGQVQGLVLWASYPASSDDLSKQNLQVTSIYASNDGLATPAKIDASRALLPPDTQYVEIQGGDHAQFGWYGPQPGDNPATIDRAAQQDQVIAATLALLQKVQAR